MKKKIQQETDRIITEAKHEKLRYLEEVHAAQRKVGELQNHLKGLEGRLAEKDALIRALQSQKSNFFLQLKFYLFLTIFFIHQIMVHQTLTTPIIYQQKAMD